LILYRNLARVDLATTLVWEGRKNVCVYQVFPFKLTNPAVNYAVPYGWQEYGQEMKYAAPWPFGPVAGYHSRGVRGWIEASELEATEASENIALASECNTAAFRDLAKNPQPGYLIQPLLLRTVRSCGDNNLYYTQKGEHQFRFALQSQADAARLGEEHNSPLMTYLVEENSPASGSLPEKLSFAQVKPDHVQLAVVKQAEDGQGIVLRLVAMTRKPGRAHTEIRLFRPITKAQRTSIIEENQANLAVQKDTISLPIGPLSIETVRVGF
jgi:alpha-mannosidase